MTAPVVLVGVDGSGSSDRALVTATELATVSHHGLVVVHVVHVPALIDATAVGAAAVATTAEELADYCHVACEVALAGVAVPWSFEVRHGDPATELMRAGDDHDAAWIVVGRQGHGRLARLVLGSVPDRLVQHCDRPVVVVPPA